jgi:hypothetical protein
MHFTVRLQASLPLTTIDFFIGAARLALCGFPTTSQKSTDWVAARQLHLQPPNKEGPANAGPSG